MFAIQHLGRWASSVVLSCVEEALAETVSNPSAPAQWQSAGGGELPAFALRVEKAEKLSE